MSEQDALTRTILYFPTIAVPNGTWLRRALLYWDEVASIVPLSHHPFVGRAAMEPSGALIPFTPEVRYLWSEGAFKPIPPEQLFGREYTLGDEFERELMAALSSDTFQRLLPQPQRRKLDARIHFTKLSWGAMYLLRDRDLAERERHVPFGGDWYLVERKT